MARYFYDAINTRAWAWLIYHFSHPPDVTHTNVGTSYNERATSYRMIVPFSLIPANQVRMVVSADSDDGTGDIELYDNTNSQQLLELLNFNAGGTAEEKDSGWTALPSNVLNTDTTITIRVKGGAAGTDINIEAIYVWARRA